MRAFIFCLLFFAISIAHGQENERIIRLSGIVLKLDSIVPVSYVHVYNQSSQYATKADQLGLFAIDAALKDTIVFTAVGRKTTYYIIPDTLEGESYSIIQKMPKDTIQLKTVEINSWPSLSQFNDAFTKEKGFDATQMNAEYNANPSNNKTYYGVSNGMATEMVGGNYTYVYPNAHIPVKDVLNPKKWKKLVNDWKLGKH